MPTKSKAKPAAKSAIAQAAKVLSTPAAAPVAPAKAKVVALRGGAAVASIALTGTPYRTGAPHNKVWWDKLVAACGKSSAPVAPLLETPANPTGVPSHFIGYALRRGYIKAVA